jgi:chaperonin cofactor prefoldin
MFMMKQGDMANSKRVDELEKRIEMLETVVKALQLSERPKVGRPPKAKDEPERT